MSSPSIISKAELREVALQLGWDDLGVTSPSLDPEDLRDYRAWLAQGFHADLKYMENPLRSDPTLFFPGAKSAILLVSYYKKEKLPFRPQAGLIASYARGRDYHHIHRQRLKRFIAWLEERVQQKGIAKGFSDAAPLMEKALAVKAGLGWLGKNTLLIHRTFGTFILLSGVLTTLEIGGHTEERRLPRCGSCRRCLEVCPTQALVAPYTLDASKCLAYHLIESKEAFPSSLEGKNPGYIFGCDLCQDVCPHNVRKPLATHPDFASTGDEKAYLTFSQLKAYEEKPEALFGTPLQRKKASGLLRNFLSLPCE